MGIRNQIGEGILSLFEVKPRPELPPGATQTEAMIRTGESSPADPLLGQQQSGEIFQDVLDPRTPDPAGHRTPDRNINLDRLDQPEEVDKIMDRVSRQTQNAGYQPKTLAELKGELDLDDDEIYRRLVGEKSLKRDSLLTGPQLLRAREMNATSAVMLKDKIFDIGERLKTNQVDDIELLDLQRQMMMHTALQSSVQKETREVARALSMHQDIARPFNTMQMDAMMNTHGGRDVIKAKINTIMEAVDGSADELTQLGQLNKAIKDNAGAKFLNQLVGYRTVQLLSSPTTHARNIVGNTMTAVSAPVERAAAAVASKIRGGDTEFGEAYQLMLGTFGSITDAFRLAKQTMKTGDSLYATSKFDEAAPLEQLPADVNKYTNNPLARSWNWMYSKLMLPGKALLAEDEFFKTLAFNGEMRAQAYRAARAEGRSGKDLAERIDELLAGPNQQKILDKVREDYAAAGSLEDPTPEFYAKLNASEKGFYEMYARSTQFAQYQTFTDPLQTDFAKNVGKALRNPFAKLVVPFYRTPVNILAYAVERSILAPITKQWQMDFAAGGARRDLAEARMAMGTATSVVVGSMVWSGTVTGSGPSNYELLKTYEADGWRRSSIKVGKSWVTYQGFDPFSTQFAVLANVADAYRYASSDKQRENIGTVMAVAFAEAMKDRSFLQGISDFIDMFDRMKQGGSARFGTSLPASFFPASSLMRNVNKTFFDDTKRNTQGADWVDTVQNELKAILPFYSQTLPPRVGIFGEEQKYDEPYGPDLMSPFMSSPESGYSGTTELAKNAVPMSQVKPVVSFEGVKIDTMIMGDDRGQGWKYYELQKVVGQQREKIVNQMIESSSYKNAAPGAPDDNDMQVTQGDLLKQAMQKGREVGSKMFFAKNKDQIVQMVSKGAAEVTFWPQAPKVTTDKLTDVPPPQNPSF